MKRLLALMLVWVTAAPAVSADPPPIDRTIAKEPVYQTKTPKYGLLVFGPAAKDRVWFVLDGETLYVDRNGNGDLTEPGEKVAAKKPREGVKPGEGEFTFEIGDLTVGGKTHKAFVLYVAPLTAFAGAPIMDDPAVKAALAKDAKAVVANVSGDVDVPGLKGGGIGGRVSFDVGFLDNTGILQLGASPAAAPVIHLGGPLEITFYVDYPKLRVGRSSEFVLVVGTPGIGPGTFAAIGYEDTIPKTAKPVADIAYQPAKAGDAPLKERHEITGRC